ncbi:hypothetical protein BJ138DRAFT_1163495 [Hygrophoropsis aurantiaca]|uniref:Uncharacterized protein n=1 Tax=Hygrophoropsis aurantiaca TaxID=72124 RepID=A0ACB7ZYD2_9AGAM|nr:hypothetical protein BJ138DRAFT_1163495 [Hygrophoropsis aurantiaca]
MADPALTIQELQAMQKISYVAAAAGALVVYDQALAFSQEVDYIWNRWWSFTTALYLIARYSGSLSVIGLTAEAMCINWTYSDMNIYLISNWAANILPLAMQAILVIRIYALFNRSKKVLIFMSTFYALQATATLVMTGLSFNKWAVHDFIVGISPAIGSVTQSVDYDFNSSAYIPVRDSTIVSVVFDSVLLFFALWAFVRHALEEKTLDGGWSINVFVRTLVADQSVYFVCFQTWMAFILATNYTTDTFIDGILIGAVNVLTALAVVAGPRMVISLRAIENNTRGEGVILGSNLGTIQFAIREPPTQLERVMVIGGGFRATDEDCEY